MDIELIEIRDFLADHPPFDQLPAETLGQLPKALTVRYLRRGSEFPPSDATRQFLYIVRKGALELRDGRGELVDKFGEGDLYGAGCSEDDPEGGLDGKVVEDSLFYLLPCEELKLLRERHEAFNTHFRESARERLRRALEVMQAQGHSTNEGLVGVEVGALIGRAPVVAGSDTTIREAARIMTRERVSCLLILEGTQLVGIVTDRDLRTRCLAEGVPFERPVAEIMTRQIVKIPRDMAGFEALITMTRLGVHHLPVVDRGEVAGVITSSDLVRYQSTNAVYLVGDVRRCADVAALREATAQLPELHVQMVASGATADHLGQAVTAVTDAVTKRLLELAEASLGAPPVPYVWVAGGSQARREQTSLSDQDNALILDDAYRPERDGDYFTRLATFVTDGLDACGYVYCPGEVMASNPKWRQPWSTWRGYFDGWIERPEPMALMLACNFFDLRPIHGEETLYHRLHAHVLKRTQENRIFLAYMVANSVKKRPPLGFFRNFVLISDGDHANTLDVKRNGIIPITDLARLYALSEGLPEIGTVERLRAAAEAGALSQEGAANLEDAFEFITTLRARHQAEQIRNGLPVDNYLPPEGLSALERSHLKDAFAVINTMQSALGQRYQAGRFF